MKWRSITPILIIVLALGTTAATADITPAARDYEQGRALLAKGDFQAAAKAFARAAKADAQNLEYRQHFMLVRQIIQIREALPKEADQQRWQSMAEALHNVYHEYGIYDEALALDKEAYAKLKTSDAAVMLAETQLATGRDAEAAEFLADLNEDDRTPRTAAMLGIAYARQGHTDEAAAIAKQTSTPKDAGPDLLFDLARLHALLGNNDSSLELLARSFQQTPPSQQELAKTKAKGCKDFAALADSDSFATALNTKSLVPESKCSSGASCGKCPSRSTCSKAKSVAASKSSDQ